MNPLVPAQIEALTLLAQIESDQPLLMVGAAALGCSIEMTWRRTSDIDIVIVGNHARSISTLRSLGFRQSGKVEHRWTAHNGVLLDVLPVTQDHLATRTLTWPQTGAEMSLVGLDLALRHNFTISLGGDLKLHVAGVPALTVMKMAAWLERPYERERDLQDIGHILREYLASDAMRRWDDPALAEAEFDEQSALALGLDLAAVAMPSHRKTIEDFTTKVTDPNSPALHGLKPNASESDERVRRQLAEFARGLAVGRPA